MPFRTDPTSENVCACPVRDCLFHLCALGFRALLAEEFLLLSPLDIYYYITLLVICQAYFYKLCKEFFDFLFDKNTL